MGFFGQKRQKGQFTYSAWDGTQAVPDFDAEGLLHEITDDLVQHGDLQAALRRLLYQGFEADGQRVQGLREMLERLRERRQEFLQTYDTSGVLQEIKERLDDVTRLEETGIEQQLSQDPSKEKVDQGLEHLESLHQMPDDAGGRLRSLQNYDFMDDDARQSFAELQEDLKQQFMEQFSRNLTEGIRDMSPEQMQAMKDMMADLNEMLRQRAQGETPDFDEFMRKHGEFFPDNPKDLDELLMNMARNMAAMQQLLASMTPEQRQEFESVMDAMMEDMDLSWQANELGQLLREAFPGLPWDKDPGFRGNQPLDMQGGLQMMDALSQMDDLEKFMTRGGDPNLLSEIDPEQIENLLGEDSARSLEQLQRIARELEAAGLIENKDGQFQLTPRGMRRIGENALQDLFKKLQKDRLGDHPEVHRGMLGESAYTSRAYQFGDPFLLDVGKTIRNAVMRNGPGSPVRIRPEDFEIEETERVTRTSTVLLLDLSMSMPMRDNFVPAKKVAMALHALISSQFPRDYLGIVGFSEVAREIEAKDLPKASFDFVYGTNMHHALMLARQMLVRQAATTKQIIMITDGEPTAHVENGQPHFSYPPTPETIALTLAEVGRVTREDIRINVFMLDASSSLRRFVERVTELNHGRAFFTTPESLGEYVLVDFLENKRVDRRRAAG